MESVVLPSQTAQPPAQVQASMESNELLKLDYEGFTLWIDCKERAAIRFRYTAQRDNGNVKRYDHFEVDPGTPAACQLNRPDFLGGSNL